MSSLVAWILMSGILIVALVPWLGRWPMRRRGVGWLVLVVAGGAWGGAWLWELKLNHARQREARHLRETPREAHPGGYVTSDDCRSCHPDAYASWHGSFHRTMTTRAGLETVKAQALPATLELDGVIYRVERRGEEFWAELPDPEAGVEKGRAEIGTVPRVWRRVSLVTGSHHMQVYWVAGEAGNLQHLFPFSWLLAEGRWVPTRDTFLRDPAKGHPFQHWNLNCLRCHVTAGQARPEEGHGRFDTRVGELGIACEACHGPAERHVAMTRSPVDRYGARWRGETQLAVVNPAKQEQARSSHICGQCHGIRWIPAAERVDQQGFSYRPGDDLDRSTPVVRPSRLDLQPFLKEPLRRQPSFLDEHYWTDGEVRVSGREFNGMVDSPCYERGEMTCLSCHSMHGYASADDQLAPDRLGDQACVRCHDTIGRDLTAHTHHAAESEGSRCQNCHMPHTTYGLLKAIRSHRISSPAVAVDRATGRPNACNLCHLDQTIAWTAQHLHAWYGQPIPGWDEEAERRSAAVVWALRGDAGQRALVAWHLGWDPALAASGRDWVAPYLAHLMEDPYSAVRFIAGRSLSRLPAMEGLSFDFVASPSARKAVAGQARARWDARVGERQGLGARAAVLVGPEGDLDEAVFRALVARRNDRSMDLQE